EFGVDNIKVESSAEGGPADRWYAEGIAPLDNIKAESSADAPADPAAAPRDETAELVNNKENTSAGAETASANGHASGENGINEINEIDAGHCEEPPGRRSNPESRYRNPPPLAEERGEGAGLLRFARNDADGPSPDLAEQTQSAA